MAKLNDLFPSSYLKAADIEGHSPIVTIASIQVEELGQDEAKEKKPVLYFEGKERGLVLNHTNANTIALITGSEETDQWVGKRIKLFVEIVPFKGKAVKAIRVRNADPLPASKPGKPAPEPSDNDLPPEMTETDIVF